LQLRSAQIRIDGNNRHPERVQGKPAQEIQRSIPQQQPHPMAGSIAGRSKPLSQLVDQGLHDVVRQFSGPQPIHRRNFGKHTQKRPIAVVPFGLDERFIDALRASGVPDRTTHVPPAMPAAVGRARFPARRPGQLRATCEPIAQRRFVLSVCPRPP